jgi:hypothetical protein
MERDIIIIVAAPVILMKGSKNETQINNVKK